MRVAGVGSTGWCDLDEETLRGGRMRLMGEDSINSADVVVTVPGEELAYV